MPTQAWLIANKEKVRAYKAKWLLLNKEKARISSAKHYEENKDQIKHKRADYYKANPEIYKAMRDKYYSANKQAVIARSSAWRITNADRRASILSASDKKNSEKRSAREGARRAKKLEAAPVWGNEFIISEVYALARLRTTTQGCEWHVDHIVPLKSRLVCGLHVEFNLRVIPAIANIQKGNRFWPDMPSRVSKGIS